MAGTSCEKCSFSQWSDQTQTGCLLNRLDKYENVSVLNDDNNGFYRVLTKNICPAKRMKSWLGENPRDPVKAVRQELFPKVQLILIVDKVNKAWIDFFAQTDFSTYSVVDVLIFDDELSYIKDIGGLIYTDKVFVHSCFPVEHTFASLQGHHINNFVRKDCQFYLLVDDPANYYVNEWPAKLDNYLNNQCKSICVAYDLYYETEVEYNNKLIYTPLHFALGGYGSQPIDDKISIHCHNHDQHDVIVFMDDIWNAGGDNEPAYNVEEGK